VRGAEIYPVIMVRCSDDKIMRPFHAVHCLAQGCTERMLVTTGKQARMSVNGIVKYVMRKGWYAEKRGYALCPEHRPGARARKRPEMKPAQRRAAFVKIREKDIARAAANDKERTAVPEAPPEVTGASVTLAETPRAATREDKRRIKDFLDEKYDDTKGCWILDWSDLKASQSLKVPRAWITAIREDFYGPDVSERSKQENQQIQLLLNEAVKLKNDALAMATRAEALETAAKKLLP